VNTSPVESSKGEGQVEQPELGRLPGFLLSWALPCQVTLISDVSQQSPPSMTEAELLADGQCEV
jgi:hypothetical protein